MQKPDGTRCNGCIALIKGIIHDSGLYGATPDIELCKACSILEELSIEEEGTNDIPELLEIYTDNLQYDRP